jgi:hypothetical protein
MAEQLSEFERYCLQQMQAGGKIAPSLAAATRTPQVRDFRRQESNDSGIQVREERMVTVSAQRMYKLRCECGRSWFELVCPKVVHCPACHAVGLVSA